MLQFDLFVTVSYAAVRSASNSIRFLRNNCYLVYLLYISDGVWNTLALILKFSNFFLISEPQPHHNRLLTCHDFEITFKHFNLFVRKPCYLENFHFIIIDIWIKFLWDLHQ